MPVISGICSAVFDNKFVHIIVTEEEFIRLSRRFVSTDDTVSSLVFEEIDNEAYYKVRVRTTHKGKLGDVDTFNALYQNKSVHVKSIPIRCKTNDGLPAKGVSFNDGKFRLAEDYSLKSVLQEAVESKEYMDAHKPFYALES